MAPATTQLLRRQYEECTLTEDGYVDENSCYVPFWATKTGVIIKWSLFLGFMAIIILYLLIGYIHAQKRIKKGLAPLRYHRLLVPRAALSQVDPRYRPPPAGNFAYGHPEQYYYDMHAMPPPPVYDPNAPRPPQYEPPTNSTKAEPSQQYGAQQSQQQTGPSGEYGPPPGPPPAPSQPQEDYAPPSGPPPSTARP
ncbi:hypothetical protein P885DRAFT_75083 [Corynascus similis CBS 632.67]